MLEFIAAQGKLGALIEATKNSRTGSFDSFREALEGVFGYSYSDLETQFNSWLKLMTERGRGVLQRLDQVKSSPAEKVRDMLVSMRSKILDEADILPIFIDEELNQGARSHAKYLNLNPQETKSLDMHKEKSDLDGFTALGRAAGRKSLISFSSEDVEVAIENFMRTFYHGLRMMQPNVYALGVGVEGKVVLIDCKSGVLKDKAPVTPYICWPPNNETNVAVSARRELPNPLPGKDLSTMGSPIIVIVNQPDVDLSKVVIKLYEGRPNKRNLVDSELITPFNHQQPAVKLTKEFSLYANGHLKPLTPHTYVVYEGNNELFQHSFTTGKRSR